MWLGWAGWSLVSAEERRPWLRQTLASWLLSRWLGPADPGKVTREKLKWTSPSTSGNSCLKFGGQGWRPPRVCFSWRGQKPLLPGVHLSLIASCCILQRNASWKKCRTAEPQGAWPCDPIVEVGAGAVGNICCNTHPGSRGTSYRAG